MVQGEGKWMTHWLVVQIKDYVVFLNLCRLSRVVLSLPHQYFPLPLPPFFLSSSSPFFSSSCCFFSSSSYYFFFLCRVCLFPSSVFLFCPIRSFVFVYLLRLSIFLSICSIIFFPLPCFSFYYLLLLLLLLS